jgi:hypothetical protein
VPEKRWTAANWFGRSNPRRQRLRDVWSRL